MLGKDNSTDFLYYTDHENADPKDPTAYSTSSPMPDYCNNYWWGPSQDPGGSTYTKRAGTSGCVESSFGTTDVLDGAVFTNDTPGMIVSGSAKPTFQAGLFTVDPACAASVATDATTWKNCDRTLAGANYTIPPAQGTSHYLPDTSASFATAPGCQYKGATRIQFNSGGTMTVWSKQSTAATTACGGPSPMAKTVPVPDNLAIYVRNDPSGVDHQCYSQEIDGTGSYAAGFTGGTLPAGTWRGTDDAPVWWDRTFVPNDMHCGVPGNVFVAGTVNARLTVASEGNIVVTGDLRAGSAAAAPTGRDMVGLVAGGSVQVAHPRIMTVTCNGGGNNCSAPAGPTDPSGTCGANRRIDASIQALRRNFFVQEHTNGCALGTLTVWGSIAQKWRGRIGTTNTTTGAPVNGYVKDYHYDKRLRLRAPPYFPYWTNAAWSARSTGETAAQYRAAP